MLLVELTIHLQHHVIFSIITITTWAWKAAVTSIPAWEGCARLDYYEDAVICPAIWSEYEKVGRELYQSGFCGGGTFAGETWRDNSTAKLWCKYLLSAWRAETLVSREWLQQRDATSSIPLPSPPAGTLSKNWLTQIRVGLQRT